MVSNTVLWEIIGADLFATVSGTNLSLAGLIPLLPLLLLVELVEAALEDPFGLGPVFVLGLLVLASYDYPGGDVGHPDGRAGLINLLTPWPGGPHGLNL